MRSEGEASRSTSVYEWTGCCVMGESPNEKARRMNNNTNARQENDYWI